ncbi:hypothetical protein FKM82_026252 [Ascaphus truei]
MAVSAPASSESSVGCGSRGVSDCVSLSGHLGPGANSPTGQSRSLRQQCRPIASVSSGSGSRTNSGTTVRVPVPSAASVR